MHTDLRHRRVEHARHLGAPGGDTLLDHAGDLTDQRVLVLGRATADIVCALTLTECRHVETTTPEPHVTVGPADLVLITDIADATVLATVRQARRALRHGGRVVARLGRHDRHRARELRLALVIAGFGGVGETFTTTTRFLSATL